MNTRSPAEGLPWAGGDWIGFLTTEEGRDLNGDGDAVDAVLTVASVARLQTRNLGLAINPAVSVDEFLPPLAIEGNWLAALVSEAEQGNRDLNGDGDTVDNILTIVDLASRQITFTGLAASEIRISGTRVAALVPESAQRNADLNGDGDTADRVLHVYDMAARQSWNSAIAGTAVQIAGEWAAVSASEAGQYNRDLNGDRDASDTVALVVRLADRHVTNTRLECSHSFALTPSLLASAVDEARQGARDANGDGDTGDQVLHVFDLARMETVNTGFDASAEVVAAGAFAAFVTEEARQKSRDLNGDGDALDSVAQVFDLGTRRVTNLEQDASEGIQAAGGRVAILTDEASQGNRDLNGDRDSDDLVAQIYDVARARLTNLKVAIGTGFSLSSNLLALGVAEADHGDRDLIGDRDVDDEVVFVYDPASGRLVNTRQTTVETIAAAERAAGFFTAETDQGDRDLNGDGDTDDTICQLYRFR